MDLVRSSKIAAALLVVGCSSSSKDGGQAPVGSIVVSVAPGASSLMPGQSGSVAVSVSRANFSGEVTLTAENLPAGTSAAFSPATLMSSVGTSTLQLTTTSSAAPTTAAVVVRAHGSGVADATAPLSFTVTPLPPSIALSAPSGSIPVTQGTASAATRLSLARVNYGSAVNFVVGGLPTGVTANLAPTSTTDTATTITFTAVISAPPGLYPVTVAASGDGVTASQVQLQLKVVAQPIAYAFCTTTPLWFAVQDAGGAWRAVTPDGSNHYVFSVDGNTAAIAYVYASSGDNRYLQLLYRTTAELRAAASAPCASTTTKTVNFTLTARAIGESTYLQYGRGYKPMSYSTTSTQLIGVGEGAHDLLASKSGAAFSSKRVIVRRQQNIPNLGTTSTIDLNGAEAIAPLPFNVTLGGTTTGTVAVSSSFMTEQANGGLPLGTAPLVSGTTYSWAAVAPSQRLPGDLSVIRADVTQADGGFQSTELYLTTPRNANLTVGAPLTVSTFNFLSLAPYPRIRAAFSRVTDYPGELAINMQQFGSGFSRSVFVDWSESVMGAVAPFDWTMPDFSTVPGWDNNHTFHLGTAVNYSVFEYGPSGSLGDGYLLRYAGKSSAITP